MDLSTVDPAVIQARGEYATVNGEYKATMSVMQSLSQQACDTIRRALSEGGFPSACIQFDSVSRILDSLNEVSHRAIELREQKEALYQAAWGK